MTPRTRPRSRSRRVSVGHAATTRPRLMLAPVWEKRGQKCKGIKNVGEKSGTGRHFWARQQSPARATRQGRLKSTQINICLGAHATGMGDASADAHPAPRGSRRNKAVEQLSLSCTRKHGLLFSRNYGLAHAHCTRVATQISNARSHACAQRHTSAHLRTHTRHRQGGGTRTDTRRASTPVEGCLEVGTD